MWELSTFRFIFPTLTFHFRFIERTCRLGSVACNLKLHSMDWADSLSNPEELYFFRVVALIPLSFDQSWGFWNFPESCSNERSFDSFVSTVCFCPWAWNIYNGQSLPSCLHQPLRPWCEPWSCWTTWQRSMTTVTWRSWVPWWQSSLWTPNWPRWSSPAVNSTVPTRSFPSLPCCQVMLMAGPLWGSERLSIALEMWLKINQPLEGHRGQLLNMFIIYSL